MAMDNFCPLCTCEYANFADNPFDGASRSPESNFALWNQYLERVVTVVALANCSEEFSKALPKIERAEELEAHIKNAVTLLDLATSLLPAVQQQAGEFLKCSTEGSILVDDFVPFCHDRVDSGFPVAEIESTLFLLQQSPPQVQAHFEELEFDEQCMVLAVSSVSSVNLKASLQACQSIVSAKAIVKKATSTCKLGSDLASKLPEFREYLSSAVTKKQLVQIFGNDDLGFGWRETAQSWAEAVRKHRNPIYKTRLATVMNLCKKLSCHVVGVPFDF